MTAYLIRRLLQASLVVIAMSLLVFIGVYAIGDPVEILISPEADQIERERAIAALGLDKPLWLQYLIFVGNALQGDLGKSFVYAEPALKLITQRMPATLELAIAALVLAIVLGIPLGLFAGLKPHNPFSKTIMATSILGFSLPTFWVGLMLIMVFAVELRILPSTGRGETATLFGVAWSFLTLNGLRHMALPALNLSLFKISLVIRLTRSGVRETILIVTIITILGSLKVFDIVWVMTAGGPNHSSEVLGTMMYRAAFRDDMIGYSSTIATVIFFIALTIGLVQIKLQKDR